MHDGHMGKLTRLIRKDRSFLFRIKRIAVDETHVIYIAGIPKHNKPAHRPAYGYFDTIRLLFSKNTSVVVLSATLPNHILKIVRQKLSISPDHLFVRLSSNRPNVMYATHRIIGSLRDFGNLSFLIPKNIPPAHDNPCLSRQQGQYGRCRCLCRQLTASKLTWHRSLTTLS